MAQVTTVTFATSDSWSFARSPRSPKTNPLRHGSLTQASISLSFVFPAMNSNSSRLDFEMTGPITWPNLRANSRIKILSSTWTLVITQDTDVHLSCGKTFFKGLTMPLTSVPEFWTGGFFSDFTVFGALGTLEEWEPGGLQKRECLGWRHEQTYNYPVASFPSIFLHLVQLQTPLQRGHLKVVELS